jgi:hypothetical protein
MRRLIVERRRRLLLLPVLLVGYQFVTISRGLDPAIKRLFWQRFVETKSSVRDTLKLPRIVE